MSYGLQAKNQNNDVVIDSDFRNFVFKQKQVLSFSPVSERYGGTIINIARQTVTYSGGTIRSRLTAAPESTNQR